MIQPDPLIDLGKCHVCGAIKPFQGNFKKTTCQKGWGNPWGGPPRFYKHECLVCYAARKKKERDSDKERFLELERKRYHLNHATLMERGRKYRERNRQKLRNDSCLRRDKNKEYYRVYQREYNRKWRAKNKDKVRLYSKQWRARRQGAPKIATVTRSQIDALLLKQRGCCAACGKKMVEYHIDHIVPLATGGTHEILNLQLLHPGCNLQKGATHPVEFMQSRGFLL